MSYKTIAIRAAKSAGKKLMKHYNNHSFTVHEKMFHDIVTSVDIDAENIYLDILKKETPEFNILTEEKGKIFNNKKSNYLWIIDPLDGTKNFYFHNPIFATSIALAYLPDLKPENAEIILGVVYAPFLKETFVAEKGKGAFLNGKRIYVSQKTTISESINTYCHGSEKESTLRAVETFKVLFQKSRSFRQLGAGTVEHSYVACGRTESIMIPGVKTWDAAAGALLVREAGGKVTDYQGNEWNLASKDILATNGKIHSAILKDLKNI